MQSRVIFSTWSGQGKSWFGYTAERSQRNVHRAAGQAREKRAQRLIAEPKAERKIFLVVIGFDLPQGAFDMAPPHASQTEIRHE